MSQRTNRTPTSTSRFGVSRRERHNSAPFYSRFELPEISEDDTVDSWRPENPFICGDSSQMDAIPDNSVALVVTSPPYFVGKEYEEALGQGYVPSSYFEYLKMLHRVFAECKRTLEPGGRIAVNVANLGRRPYRSLSSDVIRILQDDLGLLLRGEVIWAKGKGASGSCAWGSFKQATNPVLRDITERIIIASKGRFDRAKSIKQRQELNLPYESTASSDEFMEATLDLWEIPPESATRVGHPSPFPVDLPQRLIELYTFKGDLVLDPFMGSGSTLVAAAKSWRAYIGYDTDERYVRIAKERVEAELISRQLASSSYPTVEEPTSENLKAPENESFQARATWEGRAAQGIAENVIKRCGFRIISKNSPISGLGLIVNFIAEDQQGAKWYFDVSGAFTTTRGGLLRTDTLWKSLGRAFVLTRRDDSPRIILLTTHLPRRKSAGDVALRKVGWRNIFDAIEMLSDKGQQRLKEYATGTHEKPIPGFWAPDDLYDLCL